jgi:hypothetical protein
LAGSTDLEASLDERADAARRAALSKAASGRVEEARNDGGEARAVAGAMRDVVEAVRFVVFFIWLFYLV